MTSNPWAGRRSGNRKVKGMNRNEEKMGARLRRTLWVKKGDMWGKDEMEQSVEKVKTEMLVKGRNQLKIYTEDAIAYVHFLVLMYAWIKRARDLYER